MSDYQVKLETLFLHASMHELQLIAVCHATVITHMYQNNHGLWGTTLQRFSRGNVAILPQDMASVAYVLPPAPIDAGKTVCIVFVGCHNTPMKENIAKLQLVLVSKCKVRMLIDFLLVNNPSYHAAGITFSENNLNALCLGEYFHGKSGLTSAVSIQTIDSGEHTAIASASRYVLHIEEVDILPNETLLDVVGFTDIENGAVSDVSKARALQWYLQKHPFIQVSSGANLFPDRDPHMLTFLFPHLDPFVLSDFNNTLRNSKQKIGFEHQLKNMLLRYDSPFVRDPTFLYVGWNIIQKMESYQTMRFHICED